MNFHSLPPPNYFADLIRGVFVCEGGGIKRSSFWRIDIGLKVCLLHTCLDFKALNQGWGSTIFKDSLFWILGWKLPDMERGVGKWVLQFYS